MSSEFENWLNEKHAVMDQESRARLVHEFTEFMEREGIKNFDKMSPQQARQVFAALIEKEVHRLTSLRDLIEELADGDEDSVH